MADEKPKLNKHGFKEPETIRQQRIVHEPHASYRPAPYAPEAGYDSLSAMQLVACTGEFDIFHGDWDGANAVTHRAEKQFEQAQIIIKARIEEGDRIAKELAEKAKG